MLNLDERDELAGFLYAVSHDFRRPIRQIRSILDLLTERLEPVVDDEAREWLGYLTQAGDEAHLMLDRLLGYSGLITSEVRVGEVDLKRLCEQVAAEQTDPARADGTVTIDASGALCTDAERLGILIRELISNALAYGQASAVAVTAERKDGGVCVCVRDHGPGIADDQVAAALRPFGRLVAQDPCHVGLGLNYVTRIASQLGGTFALEQAAPGLRATLVMPIPGA